MRDSTVLLSVLLWAFIHLLSWVLEVSILEIRYLHYCLNSGECTIVPIFFKKHFKFKGKWVVSFIDGLNCSMQFLKGFQMDYPGARNPTKWRNWYVKRFHVLLSAHKIYVFFSFPSLSFTPLNVISELTQWNLVQVKDLWKANMMHPEASEVVNKDVISHFVLRLVYCRE